MPRKGNVDIRKCPIPYEEGFGDSKILCRATVIPYASGDIVGFQKVLDRSSGKQGARAEQFVAATVPVCALAFRLGTIDAAFWLRPGSASYSPRITMIGLPLPALPKASWRELEHGIGAAAWFCDPQALRQKGTVENTTDAFDAISPAETIVRASPTRISALYLTG